MALPSPNLDDRRFQQFVDDAKRYVQRRCPEWSDHNVSDPGVTLIEAVAHMLDQVSYRLNRVPDRNYLAFLDLLGFTLFPPAAARAEVTFRLSAPQDQPVVLPPGTEVATGRTEAEEAVVFGTEQELRVVPCRLDALMLHGQGTAPADRSTELLDGKDLPVFHEQPRVDDAVLFGLSAPVPHCLVVLRLDSRVDGVGVDPRQPPLCWEAWTPDGWRACEVEEDSTGGLNRPGEVLLHVPGGHATSRVGRTEAGWLRCRVLPAGPGQPFYSVSPTVRAATAFTIGGTTPVSHAQAVREEILGASTGVPGQRFVLAHAPVVAGDPPVLVQSASRGDEADGWADWQVVADFSASGPTDRHVLLDPASGELAFGPAVRQADGTIRQFGSVPARDTVIRAARYRTGGGRVGNVARGAISVLRSSVPYVAGVTNREAATGGVDGETLDEAKLRAPVALRTQERAVTQRDYEELARRAAPGAARLRCLSADGTGPDDGGPGAVRVLVVPNAVPDTGGRLRFEQLVPDDDLLATITRHLDERRPIGTRLAVGPPFYQGVTVVATLHAFAAGSAERITATALDALYRYLDPLTGGPDGKGWPFGRPVHAGEVYAVLQRVPGVELVDEVLLHPADPLTGRRGDATDRVPMAAGALTFPFDHRVRVIA